MLMASSERVHNCMFFDICQTNASCAPAKLPRQAAPVMWRNAREKKQLCAAAKNARHGVVGNRPPPPFPATVVIGTELTVNPSALSLQGDSPRGVGHPQRVCLLRWRMNNIGASSRQKGFPALVILRIVAHREGAQNEKTSFVARLIWYSSKAGQPELASFSKPAAAHRCRSCPILL